MRIGFTGAHGVGKTTLMNALHTTLNIPKLAISYRAITAPLTPADKAFAQFWIIGERLHLFLTKKHFVVDRTLIDTCAYLATWDAENPNYSSGFKFLARQAAAVTCKAFDYIFYIPPVIELVADEIRPVDPLEQERIDIAIQDTIADLRRRYHIDNIHCIPSRIRDTEDRRNYVVDFIWEHPQT